MTTMKTMATSKKIRTYSELITLESFKERYEYLRLYGKVGAETFGIDRYLNQMFYRSKQWRALRDRIIVRDNGCDLGIPGYDIPYKKVFIHHMNPIKVDDILSVTEYLMDPEYLICVSKTTHDAIHYGKQEGPITWKPAIRTPNDTCPWR